MAIIAVLASSQLLAMLDVSIVNTAIPTIAREFEASSTTLQWLVDSFVLLFAGLLLLAGALGDRFGRRRMLAVGMVIFALASIGASLAESASTLIGFRGLQGVGAAFVVPQTLSILTAVFPREERAKALGIWAGALGLGTAGGPLLGGALVDHVGWEAVFWVPAPIAVIALLGLRIVPESRGGAGARLDLPGAVLGTVGIIALVYGVIEGQNAGWGSAEIVAAFAIAASALVAFIVAERLAPSPMMPLRFFRQRDFNGSVAVLFLIFFALLGVMFFLAQFFQLVQGKSAFTAGLYMLPMAIGMMVMGPIAGRLIPVVGPKLLVMAAMAISTGVLVWFTRLEPDTAYWSTGIALLLFGMGGGLVMPTVTDTTMAAVPLSEAGRASGVSTTGRQMGGAIGIAVLGTIAATSYASGVGDALTGVLPISVVEQIQDGIGGAAVLARNADPELRQLIEAAAFPAFVDAITDVFTISAIVMALAAAAALFLLPLRMRSSQMSEVGTASVPTPRPIPNPRRAAELGLLLARPQKTPPPVVVHGD